MYCKESQKKLGSQRTLRFSSRNIRLMPSGPKPVRPHLFDEKDMAKELYSLIKQLVPVGEDKAIRSIRRPWLAAPWADQFYTFSITLKL